MSFTKGKDKRQNKKKKTRACKQWNTVKQKTKQNKNTLWDIYNIFNLKELSQRTWIQRRCLTDYFIS